MSKARNETARYRALDFAARVRKEAHPCRHGHLSCSDREGGTCLDELFGKLGLDNEGEWIEEDVCDEPRAAKAAPKAKTEAPKVEAPTADAPPVINGNREAWLMDAVASCVTPMFEQLDYKVPEVRVSCGFPSRSATSTKKRRIGECWSSTVAGDNRSQIFISPLLEDNETVLATLVHEVVHAVVGNNAGHGATFKKCAVKMGLAGKMTATHAGPELKQRIEFWVQQLGSYPHAKLSPMSRTKQATRLLKCACKECGYTIRTTKVWLETLGPPLCACNSEPMEIAA